MAGGNRLDFQYNCRNVDEVAAVEAEAEAEAAAMAILTATELETG